jgi:anti-sigma B factor antagonist
MEVNIDTAMGGDVVIIELSGGLAASSVEQFRGHITKLMEKGFVYILVDMTNVDFIDSSGLGACMAAHKQLAETKGMVIFGMLGKEVLKIFRITRADKKLHITAIKNEGIKRLYSKRMEGAQK